MKVKMTLTLAVLIALLFVGCAQKPISLELTNTDWTTSTSTSGSLTFGDINLRVKGTTTANSLTIETYGDGVKTDVNIPISWSSFDFTTVINFTHSADTNERTYSTKITAVLNGDTIITNLTSPPLKFIQ